MTKEAQFIVDKLNLNDYLSTARISFFYQSVPKTYLVIYDSMNKRRIITKQIVKNYGNIGIYRDVNRMLDFTPPVDLKDYSGPVKGIFISYDIGSAMRINGRNPYNESFNKYNFKVYKLE
jgi:hypothetical protein